MWAGFFYCSYTDPCQNQTRIDPAITGERFRKNSHTAYFVPLAQ